MNRELLQKVRDRIATLPDDTFDMYHFMHGGTLDPDKPTCGTSACIAGWTVAIAHHKRITPHRAQEVDFDGEAADLLELDTGGRFCMLFYTSDWPGRFYRRLRDEPAFDHEAERKVAVELLDAMLDGTVELTADGWVDHG